MDYSFTLKFELACGESDRSHLVERLADAGCLYALVGSGTPGHVALRFTRNATSAKDAIIGAIAEVQIAMPAAELE
jgi:hypothetical protein